MIANWFQLTSIPLMLLGATSPMYIGQIAEAMPTPIPPSTLNRLNTTRRVMDGSPTGRIPYISGFMLPHAEMKKQIPAMINDFLRPSFVAKKPDRALPMMHPIRALEHVKPCMKSV